MPQQQRSEQSVRTDQRQRQDKDRKTSGLETEREGFCPSQSQTHLHGLHVSVCPTQTTDESHDPPGRVTQLQALWWSVDLKTSISSSRSPTVSWTLNNQREEEQVYMSSIII